jgi:hypothetical protein
MIAGGQGHGEEKNRCTVGRRRIEIKSRTEFQLIYRRCDAVKASRLLSISRL